MDSHSHYQAALSTGRSYHYIDQRPEHNANGTTLLCIHGFPDLSSGWRNQIAPWVAQGYRVVAPDMLGYGKTDMPLETSAYTTKHLCNDLAALLDHLGVEKAVVIGHDWGSFIASRFALWHPRRLTALVILSTPYFPPSPLYVSVEQLAQFYPYFGYQVYFASERSAPDIEAHLPAFFRRVFSQTTSLLRLEEIQERLLSEVEPTDCILSDKDLEYHVSHFKRGMIGPLSYYRTNKDRFDEEKEAALPSKLPADLPVLFMYGTKDKTCPPFGVENIHNYIDRLKVVPIADVGHWVMIQAAQTVTNEILQWLGSVLGSTPSAHI